MISGHLVKHSATLDLKISRKSNTDQSLITLLNLGLSNREELEICAGMESVETVAWEAETLEDHNSKRGQKLDKGAIILNKSKS